MEKPASRTRAIFHHWHVPRDGTIRYLYDIWQPLTVLVLTICFTAVFFTLYHSASPMESSDYFFCNADGNVEKTVDEYNPFWDPQLYFTVNLIFGKFSFTAVRVIDAGWDGVVGKGGQALAAVIAYRTLRRSLTVTMESCSVTIPSVASLYCQKVGLMPACNLMYNMFWLEKQPGHLGGRTRLAMQIFACAYVLFFATLVSVMTGYRTQLTGYVGYDSTQASQLQPISQLKLPMVTLHDGSRVGLANENETMYALEEVAVPNRTRLYGSDENFEYRYNISDFIDSSRDFEEPWGVLLDYYFTCLAVSDIASVEMSNANNTQPHSIRCTSHECSCSVHALEGPFPSQVGIVVPKMTSNITIHGEQIELRDEPLAISFTVHGFSKIGDQNRTQYSNSSDYWDTSELVTTKLNRRVLFANYSRLPAGETWMSDNTAMDEGTIKRRSRCVAEDDLSYSWGFSSLILLTFCSYTMLFALALILLQTDVYWNSRHDRDHQSHSLYADVLYLAEEMKIIFGGNAKDHIQSPKSFDKQVKRHKQGLRLEVYDLPLSRWQEWRLSRATKAATRRAGTAPERSSELNQELRPMDLWSHEQPGVSETSYQEADSSSGLGPGSGFKPDGSPSQGSAADVSRLTEGSAFEEQGLMTRAARMETGESTDENGRETRAAQQQRRS
ncbi:hypothetical protein Q7P37_007924 [Cladosporium fusiforme]